MEAVVQVSDTYRAVAEILLGLLERHLGQGGVENGGNRAIGD
jgi:hypothetical protein